MAYLYGGTILRIDVTDQEITRVPTSKYAKQYIGGRGINARILYEEVGPEVKPFDPENLIAFGNGPLSGTLFSGSSRTDMMAKSPVTNLIGNANMGGNWSAELKYAGYDNIVIKGISEKPVYIYIDNDDVEIRDASHLWGKDTYETPKLIREELADPEIKVICIGPAGENRVVFASIQSCVGDSGARTGMGAVLGSKNVKAIAVRGTKGVKIADPDKFLEVCREIHDTVKSAEFYDEVSKIGVMDSEYSYVLSGYEAGGDAHKTAPNFDAEGKTEFRKFWDKFGYKRSGCFGCPVHCMENYRVPQIGNTVISCELYPQLTWEVRNNDMMLWYKCVNTCHRFGIDNTSMAITLAWLMELYEEGIITAEDTDGVPMEWGSKDAILGMLQKTIHREGFGNYLADGMDAVAQRLDEIVPEKRRRGKSTKYWAMQVNNNPMYGINPRFNGMALAYAIGRRSDLIGDYDAFQSEVLYAPVYPHWSDKDKQHAVEHAYKEAERISGLKDAGDPNSYNGKVQIVSWIGIVTGITDMVGTCKWHTDWLFLPLMPEHFAKALSAGLGQEITGEDLIKASLMLRNLERSYEALHGRTRKHDTIPEKEFNNPVSRGPWKGLVLEKDKFEKMKDEYYSLRGWDLKNGIPTRKTLEDCGLKDVAESLKKQGLLHVE